MCVLIPNGDIRRRSKTTIEDGNIKLKMLYKIMHTSDVCTLSHTTVQTRCDDLMPDLGSDRIARSYKLYLAICKCFVCKHHFILKQFTIQAGATFDLFSLSRYACDVCLTKSNQLAKRMHSKRHCILWILSFFRQFIQLELPIEVSLSHTMALDLLQRSKQSFDQLTHLIFAEWHSQCESQCESIGVLFFEFNKVNSYEHGSKSSSLGRSLSTDRRITAWSTVCVWNPQWIPSINIESWYYQVVNIDLFSADLAHMFNTVIVCLHAALSSSIKWSLLAKQFGHI